VTSLEAVIFDLDGLAIDSEPVQVEAWRGAVESFGLPFEKRWIDPYYGMPVTATAEGLARELDIPADELLARRDELFGRSVRVGIPSRPGLGEAVSMLRDHGHAVGLATSGTAAYARAILERLAAEGVRFDVVVTRDDVSHPKPDPEPYLLAAELLRVEPAACAVLEDAPNGIASAKAAGMTCVAVPTEHTLGLDLGDADSIQEDLIAAVRWLLARN
jgi:beta-phosphoglucomutase-like phosphatase (HAD superfamily)